MNKRASMAKKTNLEVIRELRASDSMWAQFSEANLLRRYYEARKRLRDGKIDPAVVEQFKGLLTPDK